MFLLLAGPEVNIFLANADILICFAMQNPKIAPQTTSKGHDFILWENNIVKCPFFL